MELLILVLTAVLLARLEKERPEVDLTPGSSRLAGFRASRGRGGTMTASLCVSAAALSLKGGRGEQRAERAPPSARHGEENGTHSLVPGSGCMSARWSLHSPTFFEDGVLKFQRCLKSSAESQGGSGGGALFRGLPLLFMRRAWCGIKDELVDGGGTRRVTVQGFTASLSDCLIEFNPLSKVSFFYL